MSQEKVDLNKEKKLNRKKEVHKRKVYRGVIIACTCVVCAALIAWIGFSVYKKQEAQKAENPDTYTIDTTAINDYMYSLNDDSAE